MKCEGQRSHRRRQRSERKTRGANRRTRTQGAQPGRLRTGHESKPQQSGSAALCRDLYSLDSSTPKEIEAETRTHEAPKKTMAHPAGVWGGPADVSANLRECGYFAGGGVSETTTFLTGVPVLSRIRALSPDGPLPLMTDARMTLVPLTRVNGLLSFASGSTPRPS